MRGFMGFFLLLISLDPHVLRRDGDVPATRLERVAKTRSRDARFIVILRVACRGALGRLHVV
jgi:hypothetical protein